MGRERRRERIAVPPRWTRLRTRTDAGGSSIGHERFPALPVLQIADVRSPLLDPPASTPPPPAPPSCSLLSGQARTHAHPSLRGRHAAPRVGVYFAELRALFRRVRFRLRSDWFGDLVSRPVLLLVSILLLPPPPPTPATVVLPVRRARLLSSPPRSLRPPLPSSPRLLRPLFAPLRHSGPACPL